MPARVVLSSRTPREQGKSWGCIPDQFFQRHQEAQRAEENAASLPRPRSLPGFDSRLATFQVINHHVTAAPEKRHCFNGVGHWVALVFVSLRPRETSG